MQNAGQVSADGRWRWDGSQWVPNSTAPAQVPMVPPAYVSIPTNSLAIVSLVAGILGWVVFPVAGAVVAIITGFIARGQIRRTGESGNGLALIGIILGFVHLVVVAVIAVVWLAAIVGFFYALISSGGSH